MKILLPFIDDASDPSMVVKGVANVHSKNSEIIALYVVDNALIQRAKSYSEFIPPDELEDLLTTSAKQKGQKYLDRLQEEFEKNSFKFRPVVRVGNVIDEIIKEVKESGADMTTLISTDNIDVYKLQQAAPLMVTFLKFGRTPFPAREVAITAGLGIASIAWYYFVFTDLDFVNEYVLSKKFYSGIVVWLILLLTVVLYGTFARKILGFIGLDTKSTH